MLKIDLWEKIILVNYSRNIIIKVNMVMILPIHKHNKNSHNFFWKSMILDEDVNDYEKHEFDSV